MLWRSSSWSTTVRDHLVPQPNRGFWALPIHRHLLRRSFYRLLLMSRQVATVVSPTPARRHKDRACARPTLRQVPSHTWCLPLWVYIDFVSWDAVGVQRPLMHNNTTISPTIVSNHRKTDFALSTELAKVLVVYEDAYFRIGNSRFSGTDLEATRMNNSSVKFFCTRFECVYVFSVSGAQRYFHHSPPPAFSFSRRLRSFFFCAGCRTQPLTWTSSTTHQRSTLWPTNIMASTF